MSQHRNLHPVMVYLPPGLKAKLEREAQKKGLVLSAYIRMVLTENV